MREPGWPIRWRGLVLTPRYYISPGKVTGFYPATVSTFPTVFFRFLAGVFVLAIFASKPILQPTWATSSS